MTDTYLSWVSKEKIVTSKLNCDCLVNKFQQCDFEYTVIKSITFDFETDSITYTWIRGFTIDDHSSVEKILSTCIKYDKFKYTKSTFDDLLAIACASSE